MAKYDIHRSKLFKKSIKKCNAQDVESIEYIIDKLANGETLDTKHKDHALKGELKAYRECHIKPDLLLIYQKHENILLLICIDIGSHNELFKQNLSQRFKRG